MTTDNNLLGPITSRERIGLIDALRGFALAGVCLANLAWLTGYDFMPDEQREALPLFEIDRIISILIYFFIDMKFMTLFSMMFGLGFAMYLQRASEKGLKGQFFFARRLMILLIFGVLHLILLWHGDILTFYALYGFLLLLFRNIKGKTLLTWGIILSAIVPLIAMVVVLWSMPNEEMDKYDKFNSYLFSAFQSGSYAQVIQANIKSFVEYAVKALIFFPFVITGRFLFGLWAGKTGIFFKPLENLDQIEKIKKISGWLGLPLMLLLAALATLGSYDVINMDESRLKVLFAFFPLATLFVSIFYATAFASLFQKDKWNKRLSVFQPLGRMALTNYLMQSFINVFVFYGIGLGLAGKVGPTLYFLWFIILISFQIVFSKWWLDKYQFGPMEWLWRSLTYGKRQSFKKKITIDLEPKPGVL
jgi:uncharacterized protein